MGPIASHRQRAHNMQAIRRLFGPVGLFIIVCGIVVSAAGLADAGADAVITGVVFVVVGAAMAALSRRRWRLEDSRYRPSRLFYAAATLAVFAFAAGMFVIAVIDESVRTVFVLFGLYMVAMGMLGVIRTVRGGQVS